MAGRRPAPPRGPRLGGGGVPGQAMAAARRVASAQPRRARRSSPRRRHRARGGARGREHEQQAVADHPNRAELRFEHQAHPVTGSSRPLARPVATTAWEARAITPGEQQGDDEPAHERQHARLHVSAVARRSARRGGACEDADEADGAAPSWTKRTRTESVIRTACAFRVRSLTIRGRWRRRPERERGAINPTRSRCSSGPSAARRRGRRPPTADATAGRSARAARRRRRRRHRAIRRARASVRVIIMGSAMTPRSRPLGAPLPRPVISMRAIR